jgi:hypothetical protein
VIVTDYTNRIYGTVVRSFIDDLTTVPYIGDDNMAYRMFCTTALPDEEPVWPETCKGL